MDNHRAGWVVRLRKGYLIETGNVDGGIEYLIITHEVLEHGCRLKGCAESYCLSTHL